MVDLIFIGVIVGFYIIAIVYIAGCGRLRKGAKSE